MASGTLNGTPIRSETWIGAWTAIRTSSQTRTHMFDIIILTETEA